MLGLVHLYYSTVVDQSDYSISYILTTRQAHDCIIEGIQNQSVKILINQHFTLNLGSIMF